MDGEDDDELEVCDPIVRPPISAYGDAAERVSMDGEGETRDDHGVARRRRSERVAKDPPSPRVLWSGVLSGDFCRAAWQRWLAMSLALAGVLYLCAEAVSLASGPAGKFWAMSVLFAAIAGATGLMWAGVTTVSCLTILQETAMGTDDIEWPGAVWIDWIQDSFYVLNSISLAALAGLGVSRLLSEVGYPWAWSGLVTAFFLCPIVLLSMLEVDSPLVPVSVPVLRYLARRWWAWLLVYLETGVLLLGIGWATSQVVIRGGPHVNAFVMPPLLVAALMTWARLWGRLGWYCTQHSRWEQARAAADADEDEDMEEDEVQVGSCPDREKSGL